MDPANLGFLPQIDAITQIGNAIEASILGQGFNVFRLSELTPPSGILDGRPVATVFAEFDDRAQKKILENQIFDLLGFVVTVDNRAMIRGDIVQQTGYKSDGGVYCFAQYRPPNETIWVRCEFLATIRHLVDASAPANPKPTGTWALRTDPAEVSEKSAHVLTQMDGEYRFTAPSDNPFPVLVPMGIQPTTRARPGRAENLPTDETVQRFVGYIPPLGVAMLDNMQVDLQDGTAFVIEQVYSSGDVGLVGTIVLLSKVGT